MDTIAERRLQLRSSDHSVEVVVKLGRPEPDATHEAWKCEYEILFGQASRKMAVHGADAMQALQLSLATLDAELEHGARKHGGVLWHLDEPFNSMLENGGLETRASKATGK